MARIDVPTMQCDRCKATTQDLGEMCKYQSLTGMYDGYGKQKQSWDLCPLCWKDFMMFVDAKLPPMHLNPEAGIQHDGDRS